MGSNSISNNSNNIRVNSNYTNKKYGSTIGKSGGSSQAALASRARTANTEEFDLSSPAVITKKEGILEKSEIIEQIENLISFFDNSKKTLEEEKENLIKKSKSFTDSANRGEYPELYWEENVKGRKKYLNPKEAIKSDKYFKKYLKDNGYPTDRERMSSEKYNSLKEEYANYINTTYTEKYNEYFSKALDMSYEKYVERLTQLSCEIEQLKASRYEMLQRLKEQPYIELMDTDDFKNYVANNKDNPNSELYKLYGIKNGTITMDDDSYWRFKYFTEQDMLIFSYLWDMQSPKAAREYVDAIEDKLNKVEGYASAEKFLDSIRDENGNIDPDVRAGVLSGAKGFENGVSTFFDGLGNAFSDEGMMSTTQYEQMYILNELTNSSGNYISKLANEIYAEQGEEVANDFLKKMYNSETNEIDLEYAKTMLSEQEYNNLIIKIDTDKKSRLDNVYELGSSFGNMAPTLALAIAVSFVAPGAGITIAGKTFAFNTLISSGLMGLSVGGNAKNQALMQGNDLYISTVYGLASGFSETSLGLLLGNIPGLSATAEFSIIGLLKEGGEEALQEGVDALLRSVLLGETIDYDQLPKNMIKSFCYGVIMSGITNGGKFAFSIVMGNETIKINSMDDFLNFVKNNVVGLPSAQVESDVVDITHSNDNVVPSINETVEQSSSINPGNLSIDEQIDRANRKNKKGIFTLIDVTDIAMMTDEALSKIDNVDNVRFRLQDGSVIDIASLLNKRNSAKMDSVLSKVSSETSSTISSNIESQIAKANMYTEKGNSSSISYSKGVSLAQYVKQYLSSNMRKFLYKDTSNFVGLNEQIMQNGLYHFTTNVDNIIASGYIKASDFIASYTSPLSPTLKSFFFNGIPEVGAVATNLDSVPVKATAIKIDPTPELVQSSKLKLRYMDDMAITYDGNFNLDGYNVQKCFFGLDIEDGKLVYKSISEAEYQNYENTSAGKMLSDYVSDKKNLIAIKSDFFAKIFEKNGISNIIDNGVSSPIVFKDKFEVARAFGDAKQLAYLELLKLFENKPIQSIPQEVRELLYKVDEDGKFVSTSQREISDSSVYSVAEKYLSSELLSEIQSIKNTPNSNVERLRKIPLIKEVIEGYTQASGPAIAAVLRKSIVKYKGATYNGIDNENVIELENLINKFDWNNGRNKASYLKIMDHVAVMDYAIESSPAVAKPFTVYRGVDQLFNGNNIVDISSLKVGDIISDKAFLSTTLLESTKITSDRDIIMKINIPEGTKGLYLESLTGVEGYGQQEFLLPRDSQLRLTDNVHTEGNKIILEMELIPSTTVNQAELLPMVRRSLGLPDIDLKNVTGEITSPLPEVTGKSSNPEKLIIEHSDFTNLPFIQKLNFSMVDVKDKFTKYYENIKGKYNIDEATQVDIADMIKDFKDLGFLSRLDKEIKEMYESHAYLDALSNQEHGIDHAERVLTFASYIGLKFNLSAREMAILIEAAKWHDCGRENVASDKSHAVKSAFKIDSLIGNKYSINDLNIIKAAIELHEFDDYNVEYSNIFNNICQKYSINSTDIQSLKIISAILKDADALDRFRFANVNFNQQKIRNQISNNLIKTACQMQEIRGAGEISKIENQNIVNILREKGYSDYEIVFNYRYFPNKIKAIIA